MPDYELRREAVSLETPDGTVIQLPSISEFRKGNVVALQARERVQRDSINYFPPNAIRACSIQFFTDLRFGWLIHEHRHWPPPAASDDG